MPFLVYKCQPSGDSVRYERLQAIKLGGAVGPIARHVKSLKGDAAEQGWELDPLTLVQLAGVRVNEETLAVLFEVAGGEPGAVCLYRLHWLCGVARDRMTHLSLDFEVLVDQAVNEPVEAFKHAFSLPDHQRGKRLREVLQLSGGPSGGDWRWDTPAMKLGATLVSASSLTRR